MAAPTRRTPQDQLRLFVERMDRTISRRAIVNGTLAAEFTVEHKDGQSTFTTDTGDEEDFRSLLLDFRSFLAPQEPVHAHRIFNIIELITSDEENRDANRHNREQWNIARVGHIAVIVNDATLNAEQCFDLYVNGDLFHQDADKAELIASLPVFLRGLVRQQMVSFVINGLHPLWATRNVAAGVLEESPGG